MQQNDNDISLYTFQELKIMKARAEHPSPSPNPFSLDKILNEIERREIKALNLNQKL